jgi:hypothetical protein
MSTKILFLTEIHFSQWHYRRFGIERLTARGLSVTVLDFTPWLVPEYYRRYREKTYHCSELVEIDGPDALRDVVRQIEGAPIVVFDNIGFSSHTALIREQLLRLPNALRATWKLGVLPHPAEGLFRGLLRQLRNRTALHRRALSRVRRFVASRNLRPYDLVLLSGHLSVDSYAYVRHKVWAHAFDYDTYLEVEAHAEDVAEPPYAVYLDEYIVGHPDLLHGGYSAVTSAERFYSNLNRCFDEIERVTGLPVVVAAHPKTDPTQYAENFSGRRVVFGGTAETVRGGSLVLGHASCSINFSMLWLKPVLILTSDDLEGSHLGPFISARAAVTRTTPLNIDREGEGLDAEKILTVDEKVYAKYFRDYIKTDGTPDRSVWEIFADYIELHLESGEPIRKC